MLTKIKSHPIVRMMTPMLISMAKENKTPAEAAQTIADLVPEKFWEVVVQIVERPDMVQYLSLFDPECAQHGPWLNEVAKELKENHIVTLGEDDDDEPEGDDDGEPGDDIGTPPPAAPPADSDGGSAPPEDGAPE